MKTIQKVRLVSLICFTIILGTAELQAQSIFDRFEDFLVAKNFQVSYGIQSTNYKNSNLRYVQERYDRDLTIYYASAKDRDYLSFLLKGEFGVVQFKVNAEIDLSPNYSIAFTATHLGYHVNVNEEYYQLGTWNNERISETDKLSDAFRQLEHSNGINMCNIGVLRKIRLTREDSKRLKVELGIMPSLGLVFAATQAEVLNPSGIYEKYDPGNKLAGYNYGLESVARLFVKEHFVLGLNINYFLMQVNRAELESDAYVEQEIRGMNYGVSVGYRF